MVLDSSITLSWLLADEPPEPTRAVLMRVAAAGAVVPSLWRLEVANALHMAVRRKRIDDTFREASLRDLAKLPIITDPDTDVHAWSETLALARQFDLTLYAACYLELAQRSHRPLATLDAALRQAASAAAIPLLGLEGDPG